MRECVRMRGLLSDLIQTQADFRAAVNVVQELDDFAKAAGLLPTQHGADVLFDLGRQLEPSAKGRARLITGTYGTGKSHLALALAALYRGRSAEMAPLVARLDEKYAGRTAQLREDLAGISRESPYLVVLVEGDQDDFDLALVRGLRSALSAAGLSSYEPTTAFAAAAGRLAELIADDDASARCQAAAREAGWPSPDSYLAHLRSDACTVDDLEAFDRFHQEVCFGSRFLVDLRLEAVAAYQDVARRLVEDAKAAGVVVIWDEFGAFMERVVQEPASAGGPVQRFAEACQDSGPSPIHLYLVAHRSLSSYVSRTREAKHLSQSLRESWAEDFKKVQGRFHEFLMEPAPEELFDLLDAVLIQRRDLGWTEFVSAHEAEFAALTEAAYDAKLFAELRHSRLRTAVVEGCYPLAPASSAFLPRVCEIVAQNQRTLFTFLCGDHPGTVASYLAGTAVPADGESLPLITADAVWDYFEHAVEQDRIGQPVFRKLRAALSEAPRMDGDLGHRLLKTMALFELVREATQHAAHELPATAELLALALGAHEESEASAVSRCLEEFSRPGPRRVLVQHRGVYRLMTGGGTDLEEALDEVITQRKDSLDVGEFIRRRWGRPKSKKDEGAYTLGYEGSIPNLLGDRPVVSRTMDVVPILAEETESLQSWLADLGGGEFRDGYVFVAIPTDDVHVGAISKGSLNYADNPQVVFLRPKGPLTRLRSLVARVDGLEALRSRDAAQWGPAGERHDEWGHEHSAATADLEQELECVRLGVAAHSLDLVWHWQGESSACRSWSDILEQGDRAMEVAFRKTPHIADEIMRPAQRKDGTANARRAVVDKLLQRDGPRLLASEPDQAQQRFVRILDGIGCLDLSGQPRVRRPSADRDAGAAEVWERLRKFCDDLKSAAEGRRLAPLVKSLRSAPYGIGVRVLPLLFAAALGEDIRTGNVILEKDGGKGGQRLQITGQELDEAFAEPARYRLRYVDVTDQQYEAVEALIEALDGDAAVPEDRQDLLEAAKRSAQTWWSRVPHYCQQTARLGERAKWLRETIIRPVVVFNSDPYEILVDELKKKLSGDATRKALRAVLTGLREEIEGAVGGLDALVADEVRRALGTDAKLESDEVAQALLDWYGGLPDANREHCHGADAGKLQAWVRESDGRRLSRLAQAIMGREYPDWSDADVSHLGGRLQGAMAAISEWRAPKPVEPGPGPTPPPPSTARVVVAASIGGQALSVSRSFRTIAEEDMSQTAQLTLRLLRSNLQDNPSLLDGERENVLLQLMRSVFGNE